VIDNIILHSDSSNRGSEIRSEWSHTPRKW